MKRALSLFLVLLLAGQLSFAALGAAPGRGDVFSRGGDPHGEEAVFDSADGSAVRNPASEDAAHAAYVSGYEDGSFRPNRAVTRAETAKLIFSLGDYAEGAAAFSDVPSDSWYEKPVNALCAAGILKGFPDGAFRPGQPVTRAEFVTILARLDGGKASGQADFPDVGSRHWARKAIALAQERGWVKGYSDGTFCPDNPVTRAEAVTIINRFYGRTADKAAINADPDLRFFPDVRPGSWYYYAVMEASIPHNAHRDTPESPEQWRDARRVRTRIKDGFYVFDGALFVVEGGSYVREAGDGTVNGVRYSCEGRSGFCTAEAERIDTADGRRFLLKDGNIVTDPGLCEQSDGLYCVTGDGSVLRNGTYQTMQFDAEGRYTSGIRGAHRDGSSGDGPSCHRAARDGTSRYGAPGHGASRDGAARGSRPDAGQGAEADRPPGVGAL